ncbi:MAG: hypothetical protein KA746_11375 [Pyrinomonadaceae bacterium]|nr:hypothetical protein [Pyrinomonadaceae bacterium]MBP6214375.1 hypothetical protein [Pyrinomonadaceae bacterium]
MLDLDKSDEELHRYVVNARADEIRSNRENKIILVIISFFICVGIVGAISVYQNGVAAEAAKEASRARMDNNGSEANARLHHEYNVIWRNGKRTFEVRYTFEVGPYSYSGICEIANRPETHKAIAIYDPENPEMNKLLGRAIESTPIISERRSSVLADVIRLVVLGIAIGLIQLFRQLRKR